MYWVECCFHGAVNPWTAANVIELHGEGHAAADDATTNDAAANDAAGNAGNDAAANDATASDAAANYDAVNDATTSDAATATLMIQQQIHTCYTVLKLY